MVYEIDRYAIAELAGFGINPGPDPRATLWYASRFSVGMYA